MCEPVYITIDGKKIIKINRYGCFSAEYVKLTGKPYLKKDRKKNWYSKTQCLKMKKPIEKDEEPVGFSRAMHGYYGLYERI